jgi:hypothetical protein
MSGTLEFPTGGDGHVTPALRDLYQPPADEAYWNGLEARILARAGFVDGTAPLAWWQVLGSWSRVGLVAAGLAALVAGAAMLSEREAERQDQYEMVLEAQPELGTPMTVAIPGPRDRREREHRIRDLLEY